MKETLCWSCKRATGFCSWSAFEKAVKGWKATATKIKCVTAPYNDIDSFVVHKCPLYEEDEPKKRHVTNKEL